MVFIAVLFPLYLIFYTWTQGILNIYEVFHSNLPWVLGTLFFCDYAYYDHDNTAWVSKLIIICASIFVVLIIPNIMLHSSGYVNKGGTIGPLYYCFGILELVFLFANKRTKIIFTVIYCLLVAFSSKRTGMLVILIGAMGYFFINTYINNTTKSILKKYWKSIVLIITAFLGLYFVIEHYNLNIINRFSMLSVDEGSGRLTIWTIVYNHFSQSDLFHRLFGHGFHAVPKIVHVFGRNIYAHNGFIEVLYDFGIFGLIFMVSGIGWLIIKTIKMIRDKFIYAPHMFFSIVCIVILSLFGYFFEESRVSLPVLMVTGYCVGKYMKYNKLRSKHKKVLFLK